MISRAFAPAIVATVLLAGNAPDTSNNWSCDIDQDSAPHAAQQTDFIAVDGKTASLSSDPERVYIVDQDDEATLRIRFDDYGGKPPIRTVITLTKSSGFYTHVVTEADRTLRSAMGRCRRR